MLTWGMSWLFAYPSTGESVLDSGSRFLLGHIKACCCQLVQFSRPSSKCVHQRLPEELDFS